MYEGGGDSLLTPCSSLSTSEFAATWLGVVVCTCNPINQELRMEGRTFKVNLAHIARPITEEKNQTNIYFWSMVGINFKKKKIPRV